MTQNPQMTQNSSTKIYNDTYFTKRCPLLCVVVCNHELVDFRVGISAVSCRKTLIYIIANSEISYVLLYKRIHCKRSSLKQKAQICGFYTINQSIVNETFLQSCKRVKLSSLWKSRISNKTCGVSNSYQGSYQQNFFSFQPSAEECFIPYEVPKYD